ncbi:MAG: hypothetical protein GY854_07690 [Deltaproteobacteria bacterium]|nr:hypothetical protein [Deltaproteobacteria bacterium]
MEWVDNLLKVETGVRLLAAARQAVGTCLSTTSEDRAVVIYDSSTQAIAAALVRAFTEVGASVQVYDMDSFGERPFTRLPAAVTKSLENATVSAMAVVAKQGELTARRTVLELATNCKLRHAHMPSITTETFEDGLSMDYREVSRFMDRIEAAISDSTSLRMTSAAGTDIEFRFASPPHIVKLDGLVTSERWQNLPSGQIIIVPTDANGIFVVDSSIGDWFESKYNIAQYPVTIEFAGARAKQLFCDNPKLKRDLSLYLRSSENSGRVSELVIGANLGLTQDHSGALFQGYRPGASIAVGHSVTPEVDVSWTASTFTPLIGCRTNLLVGNRQIMLDDSFAADLL